MRQLESTLAGRPLQEQVANRQDALVIPKICDPLIERVQVTGIAERKRSQQLKVTQIRRSLQFDQLLEPTMRPYTLVMPRGVVVNELLLELPEGCVELSATLPTDQIVRRIHQAEQLFASPFNSCILGA